MLWLIIIVLMGSFLCYLLIAPFVLEINTYQGLCRLRFHRLASLRLYICHNSLMAELNLAGWKKQIDLLAEKSSPQKKGASLPKVQTAKKTTQKKRRVSLAKVWGILKSFRVTTCFITLDFGNMELDALLYPVGIWLSRTTGKSISINFWNQSEIVLRIENNAARIIRAYALS